MAVVSSNQVAVRPFRISTTATLDQFEAALGNAPYVPLDDAVSSGWGSLSDDDSFLGQAPIQDFAVSTPRVNVPALRRTDSLSARYYWWTRNARAARVVDGDSDTRRITLLSAADVVLFPPVAGEIVGLVTAREPAQFRTVTGAIKDLARSVDEASQVAVDAIPEVIVEDMFLWLLYRLQWDSQLSANLFLGGVQEISSLDRQVRGARFLDEATVDRIELAALVAVATRGWGPAKITVLSVNPDATFAFELHADGGFQPYRRSDYDNNPLEGSAQSLALIEDLWTVVLPELRSIYLADAGWFRDGRLRLRRAARQRVLELIGDEPTSNA